jgi:hypothetical protein
VKPRSLLGRKLAEAVEPVERLEYHQVDEVACFGPAEDREYLVDRELLATQRRRRTRRLGGKEPGICVDGVAGKAEEVKVASPPLDLASEDERGAAGEREVLRFVESGDDRRDPLLEWAEHLWSARIAAEPRRPGAPHGRREHELVDEVAERVRVDVVAHVVVGSLAEDLLVHASSVGAVVEVVHQHRPAPANVEWELDPPGRLLK